jgi:predicted flap endonuclease-1-like 5' DNA nuclease
MTMMLNKLYGMDDLAEARLKAYGIKYTDDLLAACSSPSDLQSLATATGVDAEYLTIISQRADLERIRGIGDAYITLLEEIGVRSANELAAMKPEDLRDRLNKANEEKRLVGRIPALAMVNGWVRRAQYLTDRQN